MLRGDAPVVEIVSDSANRQAESGSARIQRLLHGFSRERAMLGLALRGVSPELLEPMQVEERDLASAQTRATQITGMLPFFVLMAVLYGALNAALDTTAGERERGSLEPLLMNPAERVALVLGKWGAVACLVDADRGAELLQLPARRSGCCAATRCRRCSSSGCARRCCSWRCCCRSRRRCRRC